MIWAMAAAAAAIYFWPQWKPAAAAFAGKPKPAGQPAAMLQKLIDVRGYLAATGNAGEPERAAIDTLALAVMAGGDE